MDQENLTNYEMTYVISPEVSELDAVKFTTRIQSWISSHEGTVLTTDAWGKHRLAYPIGKAEFAWFNTLVFKLPTVNIKELHNEMRHTAAIIRFLILSLDKEGIKLENYKHVDPFKEAPSKPATPRPTFDAPKPVRKPVSTAPVKDEATRLKELDQKLEELLKEE